MDATTMPVPTLHTLTDRDPIEPEPELLAAVSFDETYELEYAKLIGLGYVLTGSRSIAEDLVQDTFTEAHRRWDAVSTYENVGAWLRRVLVNKSTSRGRRLVSEAKMLRMFGARRENEVVIPDDTTEIWKAVRSLPKRQAQTIALFYWEDRSIAEIAEILQCGDETVKTHLKRGRASLAVTLDNPLHEDEGRS